MLNLELALQRSYTNQLYLKTFVGQLSYIIYLFQQVNIFPSFMFRPSFFQFEFFKMPNNFSALGSATNPMLKHNVHFF